MSLTKCSWCRGAALLGSIVALVSAGCRVRQPLPGGEPVYERGAIVAVEVAPLNVVWVAARRAMEEMKLRPMDREKDAFSGVIAGALADDRTVRVTLKKLGEKKTEISVRILWNILSSGDRQKQELILESIRSRLHKSAEKSPAS